MKNIVIVTWLGVHNYGTLLQSYSLQTAIENKGYNVLLLGKFKIVGLLDYYYHLFLSALKGMICTRRNTSDNISLFHTRFQKIVNPHTSSQLHKIVNSTDVFISGSDQIWNTVHQYNPSMFLSFAEDRKRISYASSIGTNYIPMEHQNNVKHHLSKYSHIAVREQSAVDILSSLTGRSDIVQVLDPTFLLTYVDWGLFADNACFAEELPKDYMLCYFIANNEYYVPQTMEVKKKYGVNSIIYVTLNPFSSLKIDGAIKPNNIGPCEFVFLILHAKLVCTDSFHATALAINLKIDFVDFLRFSSLDKNSQNSRIYDLLCHYRLDYKLYDNKNDNWIFSPDYDSVHEILEEDRLSSWEYLLKAIEE